MDLKMTAIEAEKNVSKENGIEETPPQELKEVESIGVDENFKPIIVGGHDITSIRSIFDKDDKNIIVASKSQLLYFSVDTCEQVGNANLASTKLKSDEKIVGCEQFESNLYVFTNYGNFSLWNLELRDWTNELALPVNEKESLISCKLLNKRQYIYSVKDNASGAVTLYYSMSRSERERPKQREIISSCESGEQNTFDIGAWVSLDDISDANKPILARQRCLTFIHENQVRFQRVACNEKLTVTDLRQKQSLAITCVRASTTQPMVATGDILGRIFLYTGDFDEETINRTKLHWHALPVSDLCFSATGYTLYSTGGESGCVIIWDLTKNNLGSKKVIARLGMPIRLLTCSCNLNQLILNFEDNEIQFMGTDNQTKRMKTFTKRTINLYKQNDYRALRDSAAKEQGKIDTNSIGLLWHSKTDSVVTNARTGWLQFYSPKNKSRIHTLDFLKTTILSLEKEVEVVPSDITKATFSLDGNWLAFYETRDHDNTFPDVRLHIWQRSITTNKWIWIQSIDRLHSSTAIVDLKFSPDGQFLTSLSEDGTFHLFHKICLDAKVSEKSSSKQMYAKGFVGNVPEKLPAMASFSYDSSVMAMSLKNDTTLIWMIKDPYKLEYECQLNHIENSAEITNDNEDTLVSKSFHDVLGLHFGYHKPAQSMAPLCEVRTNSIRIWNILNPQEIMEYSVSSFQAGGESTEFTAAAFDQCLGDSESFDHFVVSSRTNQILVFSLKKAQLIGVLSPLIIIDGSLPSADLKTPLFYTHICFLSDSILDIDSNCHEESELVKLISRLCLMNNNQELISFTDKLTVERQSASNNCNEIKIFDMGKLQAYFAKNASTYLEEVQSITSSEKVDVSMITEKQRRIRNRIQVQKMLKDLLFRIPSQNLPKMEILGPMILDKLV